MHILNDLRSQAGLDTPLSDDELKLFSNGNVELALILARCAREFKHHLSFERLFIVPVIWVDTILSISILSL